MENEIWKPISGYEGLYEVSNLGRIRSLDRRVGARGGKLRTIKGCVIRPCPGGTSDYYAVNLWRKNVNTKTMIHRLVAMSFLDTC